jgi:hypothetical protein
VGRGVALKKVIVAAIAGLFLGVGSALAQSAPKFEEIGEKAGVRFVHATRKFGQRHKAQVLEMFTDGGAAVAIGDYNNDGFDDLFVVDSDEGTSHHLMHNNGNLTFTDVAKTRCRRWQRSVVHLCRCTLA